MMGFTMRRPRTTSSLPRPFGASVILRENWSDLTRSGAHVHLQNSKTFSDRGSINQCRHRVKRAHKPDANRNHTRPYTRRDLPHES